MDYDLQDGTMKKILKENPVKKYARQMLREGEIENAEAALAAKDQVDRLQDMVEELSKMNAEELPKLVDKIRGSIGSEQAMAYQQAASGVLSALLATVSENKTILEQAVLVLTGDAQAVPGAKTELGLPDEGEDVLGDEDSDFEPEAEGDDAIPTPLGRAPRLPATESRKFNKSLSEAKIVALSQALKATNEKKFPIRAKRLAEELRRVATIAIKEEAKTLAQKKANERAPTGVKTLAQKKANERADNVEGSSKKMLKPVAEAKKTGKKPAFLIKAEEKAEAKEGKKVDKKEEKKEEKKPQPKKK
jgi:hypothetical protein